MERSKRATLGAILFLAIFHAVGLFGFHWEPSQALFQKLVPLNLLLSVGILAIFHWEWSRSFGLWALLVFLTGYGVELLGVHTGVIFGDYAYGAALGPRLWEVPPMIGVNWLMLAYCSGLIASQLSFSTPIRAAIGAVMMLGLDLLIEPVAMRFDFWDWSGGVVPLQNYVAWWCIAFVMLLGFFQLKSKAKNPLALPLFVIQAVFFGAFIFSADSTVLPT